MALDAASLSAFCSSPIELFQAGLEAVGEEESHGDQEESDCYQMQLSSGRARSFSSAVISGQRP